jgi:hypothetical protein
MKVKQFTFEQPVDQGINQEELFLILEKNLK